MLLPIHSTSNFSSIRTVYAFSAFPTTGLRNADYSIYLMYPKTKKIIGLNLNGGSNTCPLFTSADEMLYVHSLNSKNTLCEFNIATRKVSTLTKLSNGTIDHLAQTGHGKYVRIFWQGTYVGNFYAYSKCEVLKDFKYFWAHSEVMDAVVQPGLERVLVVMPGDRRLHIYENHKWKVQPVPLGKGEYLLNVGIETNDSVYLTASNPLGYYTFVRLLHLSPNLVCLTSKRYSFPEVSDDENSPDYSGGFDLLFYEALQYPWQILPPNDQDILLTTCHHNTHGEWIATWKLRSANHVAEPFCYGYYAGAVQHVRLCVVRHWSGWYKSPDATLIHQIMIYTDVSIAGRPLTPSTLDVDTVSDNVSLTSTLPD